MHPTGHADPIDRTSHRSLPRTLAGLFVPPVAWFAALTISYFMVPWACGSAAGTVALHLVSLVMLAVAAGSGLLAWKAWRAVGDGWPGDAVGSAERDRFLALLGTFSGGLFTLIILAQWLAVLMLDPCEPAPRLSSSPLIFLPSWWPTR